MSDDKDGRPINRRAEVPWHVAKEIPVAMIMAIVVQTIGVVWWAAALSAKVELVTVQVQYLSNSTVANAANMNEVSSLRNAEQDRRIQLLEVQIREVQQQIRLR